MQNRSKSFELPNELLFKIFLCLPIDSLFRAMRVCRHWSKIILSDNMWKEIALRKGLSDLIANLFLFHRQLQPQV